MTTKPTTKTIPSIVIGNCVEVLELSFTVVRNVKRYNTFTKRKESINPQRFCIHMSIAAIFVNSPNWRHLRYPSAGEWINKLCHTHAMGYYWATKSNQLLIHTTTWLNLNNYAEWKKLDKHIHILWFHLYKILEDTKYVSGCLCKGERDEGAEE